MLWIVSIDYNFLKIYMKDTKQSSIFSYLFVFWLQNNPQIN